MPCKTNAFSSRSATLFSRHALRFLLAIIFVMPLPPAHAEPVQSEIVRLKTRGDVEQAYLLIRKESPAKVVAVLFTGGYGLLKLRGENSSIAWDPQGNSFLTFNKDRFLDAETAVALIDVPTDQWSIGYTPRFRKSDPHVSDMRAVTKDLRARFPEAKLFLIGTSQGTTSAAYIGKAVGKEIDGVVLTSSVFEWAPSSWKFSHDSNLSDFDFTQIPAPLLMVHHVDDRCVATPYSSAAKFVGKYPFITVQGGEPAKDNGCGPMGPHGFLGQEESVAIEIKNWMHGRAFKADIQ